jgi:hypothetical protein
MRLHGGEFLGFAQHVLSRRDSVLAASQRLARPFSRIIVAMLGPNPTYDYYLAPRLRQFPGLEIVITDFDPSRLDPAMLRDALIFFVRYASPAWLDLIARHRHAIAGTALLLDDDLGALVHDPTIRLASRRRFYRRGVALWPRLSEVLDLLFVSTPILASRFALAGPRVLPPVADDFDMPDRAPRHGPVTVAYHGTRIHRGEDRWLLPIAAQVVAAYPEIAFEVVGRHRRPSPWRRVEGVTIVAPRPWPVYRQELRDNPLDVMLAPLLPTKLNAGRAATKRIDAARSRAALLVSSADVYAPSSDERSLGMLIELDPRHWVKALTDLAREPRRIEALAQLNREHVIATRRAQPPLLAPYPEAGRNFWRFSEA